MEIMEMNLEEVIARMNAIADELNGEGADVEALETETNSLIERKNQLIAEKDAEIQAVVSDEGETIQENIERSKPMETMITRNSPEYIDAYAEYIKTGDDKIVRALLTENAYGGTVAVPEIVENRVRTAWERDDIWNRIPKSYLKGNYKINFEVSSTEAVNHTEGAEAIDPETLVLGIVELKPQMVKKYVELTDEVLSLRGEAFLNYIYDELTYRIIKKAVKNAIASITALGTSGTSAPLIAVKNISAIGSDDLILAEGMLTGDISDLVVIMNRQTYSAYRTLQTADGYFIDAFDGMPVLFTDALKPFSTASANDPVAIVGSISEGLHANLPNGLNVEFAIDDRSIAMTSKDMVAVLGKLYCAVGVVRTGAFCVLKKTTASA